MLNSQDFRCRTVLGRKPYPKCAIRIINPLNNSVTSSDLQLVTDRLGYHVITVVLFLQQLPIH